jgi:hypothetical protein
MDDEREVIGAWLHYRGHSLNSTDPGEPRGGQGGCHRSQRQSQGLHLRAGQAAADFG